MQNYCSIQGNSNATSCIDLLDWTNHLFVCFTVCLSMYVCLSTCLSRRIPPIVCGFSRLNSMYCRRKHFAVQQSGHTGVSACPSVCVCDITESLFTASLSDTELRALKNNPLLGLVVKYSSSSIQTRSCELLTQ